jgi:hypothetical protein
MLEDVVINDEEKEIHEDRYPPMDVAPEECYYAELSESKQAKIKPSERYIFRVIEHLLYDDALRVDRETLLGCFGARKGCLGLYLSWQKPWIDEAAYFIGVNQGVDDPAHSPKLMNQVLDQIGPEYNLYVLAKNPGLLDLGTEITDEKIMIIRRFCSSLRLSKRIAIAKGELSKNGSNGRYNTSLVNAA